MILNQALIVLFRSGVGKLQSSSQIHSAAYFLCLACELRMDFSEFFLLGAAWCLSPQGALPLPFSKGPSFTSNFLNFSYSLKKKNGFYILNSYCAKDTQYFVACENYMKLQSQCPSTTFYQNTAMLIHLLSSLAAFLVLLQS